MHSLYYLKVKYFYHLILSKLIKKLFAYEFRLSHASHGHNASLFNIFSVGTKAPNHVMGLGPHPGRLAMSEERKWMPK